MNIQELHSTITRDYAHKVAELTDAAAYAYVTSMLDHLKSIGADPTDYEVIFATDEFSKYTEDGLKIEKRIRLVKREEIEKLESGE